MAHYNCDLEFAGKESLYRNNYIHGNRSIVSWMYGKREPMCDDKGLVKCSLEDRIKWWQNHPEMRWDEIDWTIQYHILGKLNNFLKKHDTNYINSTN